MLPAKVGRYEIKTEIGAGGMATVYQAYDPLVGRNVAVKMMRASFVNEVSFRARFEREVRTIATLEHAAIVPVYDFGEHDRQLYLVMRLMKGGTLADMLQRGPLTPNETLAILQQIGPAVDEAHARGIIHRDLKPANILFDDQGHAYLSDFGIVKLTQGEQGLTTSRLMIGTPAYMSPEQIQGNLTLDKRGDIYALGVILFQMLTGQTPYQADGPGQMLLQHVNEPIPSLLARNPQLPPGCELLVTRALAKNREERYQSVAALIADFVAALDSEPGRGAINNTVIPFPVPPAGPNATIVLRDVRYWLQRDGLVVMPPRPKIVQPSKQLELPNPGPRPIPPEKPSRLSPANLSYNARVAEHEQAVLAYQVAYRARLEQARHTLEKWVAEEQQLRQENDPALNALPQHISKMALWERLPDDDDFLAARIGEGTLPASFRVVVPAEAQYDLLGLAAQSLAAEFEQVNAVPLTINLAQLSSLRLLGEDAVRLAYTLLMHLAVHHSPEDVSIYIFSHHPDAVRRWGWAKWLPHCVVLDGPGESRLSFARPTTRELMAQLTDELSHRHQERHGITPHADRKSHWDHMIVLVDDVPELLQSGGGLGPLLADGARLKSCVILLGQVPAWQVEAILHVPHARQLMLETAVAGAAQWRSGRPELADVGAMMDLARSMTSLRIVGANMERAAPPPAVRLVEMLGASRPDEVDLWRLYRDTRSPNEMAARLGVNRVRELVRLRFQDADPVEMPGHVLVAGLPGSGCRGVLQTIVLSLSALQPPSNVNILLIDLDRDDSPLRRLQPLPHVAGYLSGASPTVLSDLAVALRQELGRRRERFSQLAARVHRPIANIDAYNRLLPESVVPHLYVVVEATTESSATMLTEVLAMVSEYGGGLGIHLVVAIGNPAVLSSEILTSFPTRICMRVLTVEESVRFLDAPDAAFIPAGIAGRGYLQQGKPGAPLEAFQLARVDVPHIPAGETNPQAIDQFTVYRLQPDGRRQLLYQHPRLSTAQIILESDILVQHIVDYCNTAGLPVARPLLPAEL